MIASNVKPWVYQGRGVAAPYAPSEIGKSLRMFASEVAMKHIKGKPPEVAARYFEILHRVHAEIIAAKVHTRAEIEEALNARFPGSTNLSVGSDESPQGDPAKSTDDHEGAAPANRGGRSKSKRAS